MAFNYMNMNQQKFYLLLDKNSYYPGETIKGTVHLNPDKPVFIEDIEISFNLFENWYVTTDTKTQFNNQTIVSFNIGIKKILGDKGNDKNIYLGNLNFTFPFTYKLPEYLNPSFEYPTEKYRAFLRYNISAKIISAGYPGNTSMYISIQAIPKNDINNLNKESSSLSIKKWGLFNKGDSIVKAFYPTKNYKFDDIIPVTVNVDNTNSKLKLTETKIDVIRKIYFRDKEDFTNKYTHEDKLIKKKFKSEVKKKEKNNFEFKIPLSELKSKNYTYYLYKNPYTSTNYCWIESIPSVDGGIIACEYYLKVTAYYDSFVTKAERPRIILPIYMVHKTDGNILLNQQESEDLAKAIEESKREEQEKERINEMQEEEELRRAIEESKKEEERNELQRQKLFMSNNCNFEQNNDELLPTKTIIEQNRNNRNDDQNNFNNNNINNFNYPVFDNNNKNNYNNNYGNNNNIIIENNNNNFDNNGNNFNNNDNNFNNNGSNFNNNNSIFNNNNNNFSNNFNNNNNNFNNNDNNFNNNGNNFNNNNNNNFINNGNNFNNNGNNFNNNNNNNNKNNENNFNNNNGNNFNNNINNNNNNNYNPNNNNNNFNNFNNNNFNNFSNNNNYNNGYNGNNNNQNNNNFNNNSNNNPNNFNNNNYNNNSNINNNNFNNNFNNNNYNNQNNNMNNSNNNFNNNNFNNNNFNNNNFNNNNSNNNNFNNNNFNNNNSNNNNFNNNNFNNNNSNNDNNNFKNINEIDDDDDDPNSNFNIL